MRVVNLLSSLLFAVVFALFSKATVLVNFQVAQPPPVPLDAKQCTVQVLKRDFASSYGLAEVVQLKPPAGCGSVGSWAAITLNLTVTSNGTQYDRLGIFTFQNVEIWRTSTPEPSRGDGIIWTYTKDVTRYTPLFAKPGTFIFQLDNVIQGRLDGVYSTVVHATYFASSRTHPPAKKADLIVPISSLSNNTGNQVSVPPAFSLNVTLPRNSVQVFAELYASGNSDEEFWYYNMANTYIDKFPGFLGQGPFREVRLSVDGRVAGVAYPYATIFTGGIVPTAWRPITSYGALDLPTYFIDLTPFVPILTDGRPHTISLDVVSAEADHAILKNWLLSAALQVFTDSSSKPTTGKMTLYSVNPFSQTFTLGSIGDGGDLNVTVSASRDLRIESTIVSGSGQVNHVVFSQNLRYMNTQSVLDDTQIQNMVQTASGSAWSTHNGKVVLQDTFSYPLAINLTFLDPDGGSLKATFDHTYSRNLLPFPAVAQSSIQERQIATGYFIFSSQGNTGNGTSSNTFDYGDAAGNTYSRVVNASLNKITFDKETGSLAPKLQKPQPPFEFDAEQSGFPTPRLPNARGIRQLNFDSGVVDISFTEQQEGSLYF